MTKDANRILFITQSCVGDVIMTTPVLQSLNQHSPFAKIDIVGDWRSSQLFEHCPYRGEILLKDKDSFLRGIPQLLKRLRSIKYDLIVDLRTDGLAYLLNAKKKLTKLSGKPYGRHAVEQLMGIIRSIHADEKIPETCTWLDESSIQFANSELSKLDLSCLLVIGPGCGGGDEKRWQAEKFIQLINTNRDLFTGVVLVGSEQDKKYSNAIKSGLSSSFIDLTGKTDLLQVAAVIKKAKLYIGADSGLGHIASAVGTATISLFSVDRPERCRPWGANVQTILGEDNDARNIETNRVQSLVEQALN